MVTYIEPLVKRLSPIRILENTYVELRVKNHRGQNLTLFFPGTI
jgi:hypothetical protein